MPIKETYRTWKARVCKVTAPFSRELRPKQRITQVQKFGWLMVGIYHSHSGNLSRIAGKVIGAAKNVNTVRHRSRPIAKVWLLSQLERVGEIRLILDDTKIGFLSPIIDGQFDVPLSGSANRLDLGQVRSWVQLCHATDRSAQVRWHFVTRRSTRFCGGRQ